MPNPEQLDPFRRRALKATSKVKSEISPNADKALDQLMETYFNNEYPFDTSITTVGIKPNCMKEGGELYHSKEHAMFFFNALAYQQVTKSIPAMHGLTRLFNQHPELFDCQTLIDCDEQELATTLKTVVGSGRQNVVAKCWQYNAAKLQRDHDGDPRGLLDGCKTYKDCLAVLRNDHKGGGFMGIQPKMAALYIYLLQTEGFLPRYGEEGFINIPAPGDIHNFRDAISLGLINILVPNGYDGFHRKPDGQSLFEQQLRKITYNYAEKRKLDPINVIDAMWLLSSNACNKTPGNRTEIIETPAGKEFEFHKPQLDSFKDSEAWFSSCGRCALNAFCHYYVPSQPHTKAGILVMLPKTETRESFSVQQTHISDILDF
ncbi:hypothetical protein FWF48_00290 [Candidatus Saccharibacteria bacterium]|nr:hypothetical protein [Candidatus Saccharibacteria bacterium]